jgi:hypothetical protein
MTNLLANFINYSTIGGATLMGLTLLSQPAQAIPVTVNSTQYDVTTFNGNYNDNASKFATPANGGLMPWYGNQTLADQFALAVYSLTPTNGGLADNNNNLGVGPLFARAAETFSSERLSFLLVLTSSVSINPVNSGYPVGQLVYYAPYSDSTASYATATATAIAVPWETDAVSLIGSTLLFAWGVWTKRKLTKPFNKE